MVKTVTSTSERYLCVAAACVYPLSHSPSWCFGFYRLGGHYVLWIFFQKNFFNLFFSQKSLVIFQFGNLIFYINLLFNNRILINLFIYSYLNSFPPPSHPLQSSVHVHKRADHAGGHHKTNRSLHSCSSMDQ